MPMRALTISKRLKTMSCPDLFDGVGIGSSLRPSPRPTIGTILRFALKKSGLFRSPTETPNGYINRNCINTCNAPIHLRGQAGLAQKMDRGVACIDAIPVDITIDRKSTRLNSSHSQISY